MAPEQNHANGINAVSKSAEKREKKAFVTFLLEDYIKMVYLDGDIQVYGNVDELFDLLNGHLYGALDCFCERRQVQGGTCQKTR
ncbi:hypothetical protein DCAR_0103058 [Daucus carota subsp. sativus]|uniref:Hexosyltransferase n=1 Tax=Daucus carota subsp. sativus TaxID=79200 RepID=A0A166HHD0_DAUCS|nr:hypothetical protein DCAR_0103058 [Daucus carota subsp. sativus]